MKSGITLSRNTLAMNLSDNLRDRILSGDIPQGQVLDEVNLSKTFQVSRSVVRDALARLAESGLIVKEPRKPAHVRSFDRKDVEDIFDARLALELIAVEKLDLTDAQFEKLNAILQEEHEALTKGDIAAYIEIDQVFHERLVHLTTNRTLLNLFRQLKYQIQVARTVMTTRRPARMLEAHNEHRELLEHLRKGDTESALRTMRQHIDSAKHETITWFDR